MGFEMKKDLVNPKLLSSFEVPLWDLKSADYKISQSQVIGFEVPLWDLKSGEQYTTTSSGTKFWSTPMGFEIDKFRKRGKSSWVLKYPYGIWNTLET